MTEEDWVVLELPSWPLAAFHRHKISPHIAVFTNLYPDHLNFYRTMDDYLFDKKAIYLYQKKGDYFVVNKQVMTILVPFHPKGVLRVFKAEDFPFELQYLKGKHNKENAAAALCVSRIVGIDEKKAVESITAFKGLSYRQKIVGVKDSIVFVNDTTSTTPIATIKALDSFAHDGKKIFLLLGGTSKNLPYEILIDRLVDAEKIILLKGSFTDEIISILREKYANKITEVYGDLEQAVNIAYEFAKSTGGYVLFSPAAPSFAMFNNEFHRGEEFNKIVKKILDNKI